jgi:hypothetical protein
MKPNDIEFLMHAMNCLNSADMKVVNSFRNDKGNVSRLVELVSVDRDEFFSVVDKLKGIVK